MKRAIPGEYLSTVLGDTTRLCVGNNTGAANFMHAMGCNVSIEHPGMKSPDIAKPAPDVQAAPAPVV